jgi:hypothetical protein
LGRDGWALAIDRYPPTRTLLIDTNILDEKTGSFAIGDTYGVTARSLLLFELQTKV